MYFVLPVYATSDTEVFTMMFFISVTFRCRPRADRVLAANRQGSNGANQRTQGLRTQLACRHRIQGNNWLVHPNIHCRCRQINS